jgi:hypothetical protein
MNIWISILLIVLAIVVTHHFTFDYYTKKTHVANIEAVKEKTARETEEKVFSDFMPDQHWTARRTGLFKKQHWLVITERLLYKGLPVSGWMEHSILVNQELDKDALIAAARAASFFLPKLGGVIDPMLKLIVDKKNPGIGPKSS